MFLHSLTPSLPPTSLLHNLPHPPLPLNLVNPPPHPNLLNLQLLAPLNLLHPIHFTPNNRRLQHPDYVRGWVFGSYERR